jgi:hypothetical protein
VKVLDAIVLKPPPPPPPAPYPGELAPPAATIKYRTSYGGPAPPPPIPPNPAEAAAPLVPIIGIIFLLLIYYANCVCAAKTVNVASPVFIIV